MRYHLGGATWPESLLRLDHLLLPPPTLLAWLLLRRLSLLPSLRSGLPEATLESLITSDIVLVIHKKAWARTEPPNVLCCILQSTKQLCRALTIEIPYLTLQLIFCVLGKGEENKVILQRSKR